MTGKTAGVDKLLLDLRNTENREVVLRALEVLPSNIQIIRDARIYTEVLGELFELARKRSSFQDALLNYSILRLADQSGWTVAHALARHGSPEIQINLANRSNVLTLRNNWGWSVAHELAREAMDLEVLRILLSSSYITRLTNIDGHAVAHELARGGEGYKA